MKSILKYPGGKSWLATRSKRLITQLDPKFVAEPFCGGLSFSLNNEFERVLANDVITPLINLYQHAQRGFVPNRDDWELDKEFYFNIREQLNKLIEKGQANCEFSAGAMWYLSYHGFNGLMRFNLNGRFNVPFGQYDEIADPSGFSQFTKVTRHWTFTNCSFLDLNLAGVDLLLADPPYAGTFSNYSGKGFNFNQQIQVADWLADHSMPMIACNSLNRELARIYKARGFSIYRTDVPRSISRNGKGRKSAPEMIAFKGFGKRKKFSQLVDNVERWRV
ncbi:Dam family site-specific DNA-(adenine-N6)-methyltransferase [Vibrio parahaemolyticus]|nr:Dam family site-specific DNA-(adenine-N6)-methyltransferase [Vibrio sp. Vb0877]EGQ7973435.1 Dam family site-specific DNA-(adenine-N6)-methyltransferase [Vibrio parahaemolyticus]MBO0208663.1 Dam family site-specific DNA-(adenine-N6)-methyltransferase [Vibrio sp. Vb0877]